MKAVKDPYRGYRKYMKGYCEICGKSKYYHPQQLEAHHKIPQSYYKNRGEKIKHKGNVITLCGNHHVDVEIEKLIITRHLNSSEGQVLEFYESNNPDELLYGF